jgi:hypothetical protein
MSSSQAPNPGRGLVGLVVFSLMAMFSVQAYPSSSNPVDYVIFKNGDKLSGALVRFDDSKILFKSDVVGEVTFPVDKVQELRSHGSFVVIRKEERITRNSKRPGGMIFNNGSIEVADLKGPPETVSTKDLGQIIDHATYIKEVASNPGPFQRWVGSITGGATIVNATSRAETYTIGVNLIRAIPSVHYLTRRTRTTFNLLETFNKLTEPVIPQTVPPSPASVARTHIFHTDFEHNKYFTPKLYALGSVTYDHNSTQGLDLQQAYGAGLGATLIEDEDQQLDLKSDLHYMRQNFVQFPPPEISTPNQNLIGSTFTETYRRALPAKIALTQSINYTQSWNNTHVYSFVGALGLSMPFYHRLSLSVNTLNSYLNDPAAGFRNNSFQFVTGVTYTLP